VVVDAGRSGDAGHGNVPGVDGRAAVRSLFDRLFRDHRFRAGLLEPESDEERRQAIAQSGVGPYTMADVTEVAREVLYTGRLPGARTGHRWRPAAGQTWADAPIAVLEARRRAIVCGAPAGTGAADTGYWPCPRLPCKLSFAIVGAIKGGTTALDYFLGQHPDVCTAIQKETHFFCRDIFFRGDRPKYEWLDFSFPGHGGEKVVGEATPEYMYFATAAERMYTYNPDLKLVILLRDPADRAYSQYRMEVARGAERRSFANAVAADLKADDGTEGRYTAGGFYLAAIDRLSRWFPFRQIHFLRTEDLACRHQETLSAVHEFLAIDRTPIPTPQRLLVGPGPDMNAEDRSVLTRLYRSEIDELEVLLGWDLSSWRS
jgi:hypothetical protein